MNTYTGKISGAHQRIGIVVVQFNDLVTTRLLNGALTALKQFGVADTDITVTWVPGALELPRAAKLMAASGKVNGIIALGAVVRGETSHYDYVCANTASGLADVSLNGSVPVMFGVLTTDTMDQAMNRAGGKAGNKGSECASGVLEMIHLGDWIAQ
ncbi:6,7-dimethyl-8-ribityllumazine synthase [Secundilactobacillus paracollinoides]|uniref:6,7-dimethyl-8-ribityllumazine synthase n=1 Tax=Secundilactobacillus paracollinoides TaxID=240427 RepID=UPI00081A7933|nr:6,7-dimethyl-8-ribityllumazine synthase [Secundilactobacillus paracollinoides]ANZ60616.1 6,7-dimethyl-8-ribityllumazine synthase [Secundilactobacillus paracollinoides]